MEATESLVAALLQARGYIVSTGYKLWPGTRKTFGGQSISIDIDVHAVDTARQRVIVGEVKSYWSSQGISPESIVEEWTAEGRHHTRLKLINNKDGVQTVVWDMLKEQVGARYKFHSVLFAGKIQNRDEVKSRLEQKQIFDNKARLVVIGDMIGEFLISYRERKRRSYIDDPAIATIVAMEHSGMLRDDIQNTETWLSASER